MKLGHRMFLAAAVAVAATGCNVFDPFDSPTSDAQLISAARACLDQGDFQCASDNYQKLANSPDIKASELAYTILDQSGADMGAFMGAFGTGGGNVGAGLTKLAQTLSAKSPGEATRLSIYNALKAAVFTPTTQVQDLSLQSLVEFLTATALASEILSEVTSSGILHKTDFAASATCTTATCGTGSCAATSKLQDGSSIDIAHAIPSGPPTLYMLTSAINYAVTGLNQLGASGGFGSLSSDLTAIINAPGGTNCVRAALIDKGVGVN